MKKILFSIFLMLCTICIYGQSTTTVSFTITDNTGTVWTNGSVNYVFKGNGAYSGQYQWNGSVLPSQYLIPQTVQLDGTGSGSFTVPSSFAITPAGSTWSINVCPNASSICQNFALPINGTSQNISSSLAVNQQAVNIQTVPLAYSDSQIKTTPAQGGIYYNTGGVSPGLRYYYQGNFYPVGGSGTGIQTFSTTGTTGAATWNPTTGALNIPNLTSNFANYFPLNPTGNIQVNLASNSGFRMGHCGNGLVFDTFDHINVESCQGYTLGVNASPGLSSGCVWFVGPDNTYGCANTGGFINWAYIDFTGKLWGWNGSLNKAVCLQDGTYCPTPSTPTGTTYINNIPCTLNNTAPGCTVPTGNPTTTRTCSSNGCYRVEADGTIEEWGKVATCGGSPTCTVSVTFPLAFTTTNDFAITATCIFGGQNCIATVNGAVTTTGFTFGYASATQTGGSGNPLDGTQTGYWRAIGH